MVEVECTVLNPVCNVLLTSASLSRPYNLLKCTATKGKVSGGTRQMSTCLSARHPRFLRRDVSGSEIEKGRWDEVESGN